MRISLVLDCLDPDALAPFCCTAMGYDVVESIVQYAVITPGVGEPPGPAVILQGVPESKLGKSRAHSDVHTQEFDAHVAILESMGGHRVGTQLEGYGMLGNRWPIRRETSSASPCTRKQRT